MQGNALKYTSKFNKNQNEKGLWKGVMYILVAFPCYWQCFLMQFGTCTASWGRRYALAIFIKIDPHSVFMGRYTPGELKQGLPTKEPHQQKGCISCPPPARYQWCSVPRWAMSGYHADTPITIKAEAIHEADSRIH